MPDSSKIFPGSEKRASFSDNNDCTQAISYTTFVAERWFAVNLQDWYINGTLNGLMYEMSISSDILKDQSQEVVNQANK